eukprot:jgi/Botrbrau1/17683/Bobra.0166s0107.1
MTTDALRAYAQARESSFFKLEQEADLARHRSRMVSEGRLEDIAGANLRPRRHLTLEESVQMFEVLPEVLQQQTRVDDPNAVNRKEIVRRIRAQLPKLTEEEAWRYRTSMYGVAGLLGSAVPQVRLGRDRYWRAYQAAISLSKTAQGPVSPAATELAARSVATGARSLMYGTGIAIIGTSLLTVSLLRYAEVSGTADLRDKLRQSLQPLAADMAARLEPFKEQVQGVFDSFGISSAAPAGQVPGTLSEHASDLQRTN